MGRDYRHVCRIDLVHNMRKKLYNYKRRLKSTEAKMAQIESSFPDIDFKNTALRSAFHNYLELLNETIYLSVDIKFCSSENRKESCLHCDCWKNKL